MPDKRFRVYVPAMLLLALVVGAGLIHIRLERAGWRAAVDSIRRELETSRTAGFVRPDKDGRRIWALVRDFYSRRDYEPAWVKAGLPGRRVSDLADALRAGERVGLNPNLYQREDLDRMLDGRDGRARRLTPEEAGRLEVWLTYTYLQYASDLADGISDLAHADPKWRIQREPINPVPKLEDAIDRNRIAESLEDLNPKNPEYIALRKLLAEHRERAGDGRTAVGTTGANDQRIRQIELNLERWRWVPRDRGTRHIVINIPAYRLDVWEQGKVVLTMRVVVGKKDTPTPIFDDAMTHVVFSPYWNVPATIARNETLPAAVSDPSFLRRTNMDVLDSAGRIVDPASIDPEQASQYRFRQRPGTGNSLGLVKFMFPNEFNVYLHDTPADSLFARVTRSFSHGCVRVEQPKALAEYVLRDQPEWTPERIAAAMESGDERVVKLREPIPVFIGYWTVDVAPDGTVQFLPDVYGVDVGQGAMLTNRLARLRSASRMTGLR